jgi:hypothetical protein
MATSDHLFRFFHSKQETEENILPAAGDLQADVLSSFFEIGLMRTNLIFDRRQCRGS